MHCVNKSEAPIVTAGYIWCTLPRSRDHHHSIKSRQGLDPSLSSRKVTEVTPSSFSITMANIRQNYNEECEALINKHVNTKLYHSYVYLYLVRKEEG